MSQAPGEAPPALLGVGYSPCPNDTFIFHALVTGRVPVEGVSWRPVLDDVETLNRWAFERRLPVTKISFHAFGRLRDAYVLLRSGAALGRGCGPLVVARGDGPRNLEGRRIAVPGRWTSATLLLRLFEPGIDERDIVEMPFHRIIEGVARGEVDAGLIIHESRFTYQRHGLRSLVDLGAWWEERSGLPIPLGGILADRRLGRERILRIEEGLRASVLHARARPAESRAYVLEHAQELEEDVVDAHIALYVNDFTVDLGAEGIAAVRAFLDEAERLGILPGVEGANRSGSEVGTPGGARAAGETGGAGASLTLDDGV